MIERLFFAGIVLLRLSAGSVGGIDVAPADFDTVCNQHASFHSPTEKILLDTQYYESQSLIDVHGNSMKWLSLDLDNTTGTSSNKVRTYIGIYTTDEIFFLHVKAYACMYI